MFATSGTLRESSSEIPADLFATLAQTYFIIVFGIPQFLQEPNLLQENSIFMQKM